jgi:hypothetical protein
LHDFVYSNEFAWKDRESHRNLRIAVSRQVLDLGITKYKVEVLTVVQ